MAANAATVSHVYTGLAMRDAPKMRPSTVGKHASAMAVSRATMARPTELRHHRASAEYYATKPTEHQNAAWTGCASALLGMILTGRWAWRV